MAFRARLIAHQLDRRLVEGTVELYQHSVGRSAGGRLRAALDASPLWGAGRVEDTINLVGHALRTVLGVIARQQGWGLAEGTRVLAERAGVAALGAASLKAGLDLDWDDPAAVGTALGVIVEAVGQIERLAAAEPGGDHPRVAWGLAAAGQVCEQDTIVDGQGRPSIRRGVAKDRRISIHDPQMRHGRKTRSVRVDGYKRHVLRDLDHELIRAVGVTAANVPEAAVTPRSKPTWTPSRCGLRSCISTGRTCPAAWSATATPTWPSTARRSRCAPAAAGSPRPHSRWTSTRAP